MMNNDVEVVEITKTSANEKRSKALDDLKRRKAKKDSRMLDERKEAAQMAQEAERQLETKVARQNLEFMNTCSIPAMFMNPPNDEKDRQNDQYEQAGLYETPHPGPLTDLPHKEAFSQFIHRRFKKECRGMFLAQRKRLGEENA